VQKCGHSLGAHVPARYDAMCPALEVHSALLLWLGRRPLAAGNHPCCQPKWSSKEPSTSGSEPAQPLFYLVLNLPTCKACELRRARLHECCVGSKRGAQLTKPQNQPVRSSGRYPVGSKKRWSSIARKRESADFLSSPWRTSCVLDASSSVVASQLQRPLRTKQCRQIGCVAALCRLLSPPAGSPGRALGKVGWSGRWPLSFLLGAHRVWKLLGRLRGVFCVC